MGGALSFGQKPFDRQAFGQQIFGRQSNDDFHISSILHVARVDRMPVDKIFFDPNTLHQNFALNSLLKVILRNCKDKQIENVTILYFFSLRKNKLACLSPTDRFSRTQNKSFGSNTLAYFVALQLRRY
jgi:hypothetical protein